MTTTRLKILLGAAIIAAGFVGGAAVANADSLEAIMQVGKERTAEARASQTKIDRLADETRDLLADYKTVMKQVEGLRVYNARPTTVAEIRTKALHFQWYIMWCHH